MLEEELIDLMTFCLQNSESSEIAEKKKKISEIGKELYDDGGLDALENFFFVLKNGKPAVKGTCPTCSTKMFRIGKG